MKKAKGSVGISGADRRLQVSAAMDAYANARLQQSLLNARNLRDFVDLINLDMSELITDEIEDSKEDVAESKWQDCVSVKWNGKGVIREFNGHVTNAELEQSAIFVQQHPKFSSSCYVIHDFRKCTSLQVSDTDAFIMASRAAYALKTKPSFRSAFVGNLPALKQLVDTFKKVTNYKMPFERFTDMQSARLFSVSLKES
jgi:hypothetical protein